MTYLAFIICLLYGILIVYMIKGVGRLKTLVPDYKKPSASFTVLVPFRNEEINLPGLLKSMAALDYPRDLFEIIMINDDSSDTSVTIINSFKEAFPDLSITLTDNDLRNTAPKKDAIEKGITLSSKDWVITTDADCLVPTSWMQAFNSMINEEEPKMIVAPVSYVNSNGFLHKFQLLDFLSLQGITMGSFGMKNGGWGKPFLCNGANLCYRKDSFKEVHGFAGNEHIASGDDVFLLEKMMQKFPDQVAFIKSTEAIVLTSSKDSVKDLIEQRVRWASKTTAYDSLFSKLTGLLVFANSLSMIIVLGLGIAGHTPWLYVGLLFLIKFNVDFVLLFKTSEFFEQQEVMKSYFMSSILHPFFTILVAMLSLRKNYTWKGFSYYK